MLSMSDLTSAGEQFDVQTGVGADKLTHNFATTYLSTLGSGFLSLERVSCHVLADDASSHLLTMAVAAHLKYRTRVACQMY